MKRTAFISIFLLPVFLHTPAAAQPEQMMGTEGHFRIPVEDSSVHQLIHAGIRLIDQRTDSALFLLYTAWRRSERTGDNDGIALSLMAIATCHTVKNDIPAAIRYLRQAYPYCLRSVQKNRLLIEWYRNQFLVYKSSGRADSALAAIQKTVPLIEQVKDTFLVVNMYNHIGSVLIDNQDYENAYPYIIRARDMNMKQNADMLVSWINLGYIYSNSRRPDSIYFWASRAFDKARELKYPRYERSASLLLVQYCLWKGDEKKSDEYAQNAIRLIDTNASDNHLYVYRALCMIYMRYHYKKALAYGNIALQHLKPEQQVRKDVIHLYAQMSDIYHAMGDAGNAYKLLLTYNNLSDSINLLERNKAVDRLEKQFQLSEKEKEIALKENQLLLQQNKVRSRNIWIAVIGGGLVAGLSLSGLLYSLYRGSKRKMRIMRQQKEIDELRATMDGEEKERNRIAVELHDNIGGMLSAATYSLDTIKNENDDWAQNNSLKKIDSIITEVRNEIRKTAHTLMPDVLLRHSLPEAIRQYCSFIERDTGLQIDVQEQGDFEHLSKDLQLSLYRITQELIQNILKHARATRAIVQIHSGKDIISLTVEDNGTGFDGNGMMDGRGLLHIRNRLLVINGKLSIDSEPGKGTSVYVEIQTSPIS